MGRLKVYNATTEQWEYASSVSEDAVGKLKLYGTDWEYPVSPPEDLGRLKVYTGSSWEYVAPVESLIDGATLAYDTFTDTNGTLLTSHTPEIGGSWSEIGTGTSDQAQIHGNQAYGDGSSGHGVARRYAVVPLVGDGSLTATFALDRGGVFIRANGSTERWEYVPSGTTHYLYRYSDGGSWTIQTINGAVVAPSRVRLKTLRYLDGTRIRTKAWALGTSEPTTWATEQWDYTAANQCDTGMVGVFVNAQHLLSPSRDLHCAIDDFRFTVSSAADLPATYACDTFTDDDDTDLVDHVPDVGGGSWYLAWSDNTPTPISYISSGYLHIENETGWCDAVHLLDGPDIGDADITMRWRAGATEYSGIVVRSNGSDTFYHVSARGRIERYTNGVMSLIHEGWWGIGVVRPAGMRVRVEGSSPTRIRVKTWSANSGIGDCEPNAWDDDQTDNTAANQMASGKVGIYTYTEAGVDEGVFDNFSVREID